MHPASTKMDRPFGRILGLLLLLAAAIGTDAFIVRQQQLLPPRRSAPYGGAVAAAGGGRAWQRATTSMAAQPCVATDGERHRVLIIGGGTGGVGVAAHLLNEGVTDVCVVEPAETHFYQPGWTFVGSGIFSLQDTARPMAQVLPDGVRWLRDAAAEFKPAANQVVLKSGATISYDYLVVAMGLQCDWHLVPGLPEALARGDGVCSNYDPKYAAATWEEMQRLGEVGGNAIFTQPDTSVKCGGAPQKVMWLTEDYLRREGRRDKAQIYFSLPPKKMFGVDKYVPELTNQADARGINRLFETVLASVDGPKHEATFRRLADQSEFTMPYTMLHVTPPMSAPDVLKRSPIVNEKGFVDVDKRTTQHHAFPNIFALGDASSLPTSKTMAAITGQAPVLTHNLLRVMAGKRASAQYDGFTSCPIVLGYDKLLMTEFKYDCIPAETFTNLLPIPLPFLDQGKPSFFYFLVKKFVFPFVYWNLFIHGRWYGSKLIFKPDFTADDARVDSEAKATAGGAGGVQQQRLD